MFNNYQNPYAYPASQNFGYGNPYYNGYAQQQSQQQLQPQQNYSATNTNKIYVSGIDDVKKRELPPNSDVLFIDNDKDIIYEKIVDSKGQFEIKMFDLGVHKPEDAKEEVPSIDLSGYVKTTDLEPLQREIKGLKEQVIKLNIQNEMSSIKKED